MGDTVSRTEMIEFLRHVLELEGNVYTANKMINQLRSKASSLGKHNIDIPEQRDYTTSDAINVGKKSFKVIVSSLGTWFAGLCIIILCQMAVLDTLSDMPIIMFTFGVFVYCVVRICYFSYGKKKEIRDYNDLRNDKLNAQREKNARELKQKQTLEAKISIINGCLNQTYELLNKLYNVGDIYIYPKYRNIIAMAQILEYYESGRRDCLEGVNGAYDLFEAELRQNIIINSLSQIENTLDAIRQNQGVLYNELQRSNNLLISMKQDINQLTDNIDEMKINSYVTSYNTMAIAKNMNAENYMKVRYQKLPYDPV